MQVFLQNFIICRVFLYICCVHCVHFVHFVHMDIWTIWSCHFFALGLWDFGTIGLLSKSQDLIVSRLKIVIYLSTFFGYFVRDKLTISWLFVSGYYTHYLCALILKPIFNLGAISNPYKKIPAPSTFADEEGVELVRHAVGRLHGDVQF